MNGMRFNKWLIFLLAGLLYSCMGKNEALTVNAEENYQLSPHVISAEQFAQMDRENLFLVDHRKAEAFSEGHIPGAMNIWRPDIQDSSYPFGGMRASKSQLESLLSKLGASTGDTIVVYDDKGGVDALRLIWLLKYYGYEACCLLDGGTNAWLAAGYKFTKESKEPQAASFKLNDTEEESILASKEEVLAALGSTSHLIVDARSEEEFSGKRQKKGAFRAGHIPGAMMIDFYHNIDYNTMKLKPASELRKLYESQGVSGDKEILVYCQSGVRSAQTSFVLRELLKYKKVKNYDGSWIDWSYHEDLPIEKDSVTSIFE